MPRPEHAPTARPGCGRCSRPTSTPSGATRSTCCAHWSRTPRPCCSLPEPGVVRRCRPRTARARPGVGGGQGARPPGAPPARGAALSASARHHRCRGSCRAATGATHERLARGSSATGPRSAVHMARAPRPEPGARALLAEVVGDCLRLRRAVPRDRRRRGRARPDMRRPVVPCAGHGRTRRERAGHLSSRPRPYPPRT
jgi:hypothetical protein